MGYDCRDLIPQNHSQIARNKLWVAEELFGTYYEHLVHHIFWKVMSKLWLSTVHVTLLLTSWDVRVSKIRSGFNR